MSDLDVVPSTVLDAITEGMILTDVAGAILFVNREAQDILGCAASELIGQSLETLIAAQHNGAHAVELRGYLDAPQGQLIRRRYKLTGDTWQGRAFPRKLRARAASGDRRMLIVSIRGLTPRRPTEQVRQYDRRLRSLREIGQAIRVARTPDVAAQTALRHIRRLVPCAQAVVLTFDLEVAEALVLAALPHKTAGTCWPLGVVEGTDVLRRGRPYVIGDTAALPEPPPSALLFGPACVRGFAIAPLVAGGQLIGALAVATSAPHALEQSHVAIVCEVADQLAIALQNNHLLQQVRTNSERLRALSRQLMELQENERRHIARELHDEIGQSLTAVKINLETMLRLRGNAAHELYLVESITIVERVLQQVRALSRDLRPSLLDDLGLESALRWYVGRQADRAGFAVEFSADPIDGHLPPEIETTCFRVAQEALTNIARHAHARHVRAELRRRGATLRLVIADDGVGFDLRGAEAKSGLGLIGMHERVLLVGGELVIDSAPGCGTTIRARFSLSVPSGHLAS